MSSSYQLRDECPCANCNPAAWWMILCPNCGNKRCPRASWHEYECTRSNEYGQVGTRATPKEA